MNTKEVVDIYYKESGPRLQEVAKNILSKINRLDLADSLVTDSYMYIYEKIEDPKIKDLIQAGKIESIAVQFMYKQIGWSNTKFKKTFIDKKGTVDFLEGFNYEGMSSYLEDEEDLLEQEYEHQRKISHIEGQKHKLDVPGRILYDIAIVGEHNNSGKLSRYLGLNRVSTYHMIKNLKSFLREGFEENNENL